MNLKKESATLWGVPIQLWRVLLVVVAILMTELVFATITISCYSKSTPTPVSVDTMMIKDDTGVGSSSSEHSSEHAEESSSTESLEIAVMSLSYVTAIDDDTDADDLVVDCVSSVSGTAELHIPDPVTDDDSDEEDLEDSDASKEDDYGRMLFPPEWWENTRMSYMDYRTITDPSSDQWRLQQKAVTDPVTGIRTVNGRYCVAVGSAITTMKGAYIDVTLQNGVRIPCVLADCKRDCDTIDTFVGADGGIVEFVVDTEVLPNQVQLLGSNEAQFNGYWASPVAKIFVWDESSNGYYDWD